MTAPHPSKPYFLKFWYRPAAVVCSLVEAQRGQGGAVLIGVMFGLVQSLRVYLASEVPTVTTLLTGALGGALGVALFGWLLRNFSRWFGGQTTLKNARTGLGFGLLPWTILFTVFLLISELSQSLEVVGNYFPLFFLFFIYGYYVLLMSLSAALNLSVLKTFLCLVVTVIVSLFPLTLVMQLTLGIPQ
jgi:hypothetical protein